MRVATLRMTVIVKLGGRASCSRDQVRDDLIPEVRLGLDDRRLGKIGYCRDSRASSSYGISRY